MGTSQPYSSVWPQPRCWANRSCCHFAGSLCSGSHYPDLVCATAGVQAGNEMKGDMDISLNRITSPAFSTGTRVSWGGGRRSLGLWGPRVLLLHLGVWPRTGPWATRGVCVAVPTLLEDQMK